LVLLETLGFVLKVGTCHYTMEFFFRKKQWFENGLFSPFLVLFCLHNAKCPGIFLHLATVVASVITDFKILNMCTSIKDKHYFWKLVAKEVKWVNENMSRLKWISRHFWVVWDQSIHLFILFVLSLCCSQGHSCLYASTTPPKKIGWSI
jgi:hypothetical protein